MISVFCNIPGRLSALYEIYKHANIPVGCNRGTLQRWANEGEPKAYPTLYTRNASTPTSLGVLNFMLCAQ